MVEKYKLENERVVGGTWKDEMRRTNGRRLDEKKNIRENGRALTFCFLFGQKIDINEILNSQVLTHQPTLTLSSLCLWLVACLNALKFET